MTINNTKNIANNKPLVRNQSGFTLIELMISILLGILVTAAAVSILISSTKTSRVQDASSSIQDSMVFPISKIKQHLRRANYGSLAGEKNGYFLSHDTPQGGIVLTAPSVTAPPAKGASAVAVTNLSGLKLNSNLINANLLTQPNHSDSNIDGKKNDQLTIQYQMPQANRVDCQGREIPQGDYVIERYFVRDDNGSKSLACASTNYTYNEETLKNNYIDISNYNNAGVATPSDFAGNGTVLIHNVDYFKVLFNVTTKGRFATKPDSIAMKLIAPSANNATTFEGNRIAGVQIGMILKSNNTTMSGKANADQKFNILNETDLKLTDAAKSGGQYMRDSYETNVLIRNARGTSK